MNAGKLNEIIEILKPVIIRDDYGNQKTTYQVAYRTRAYVQHSNGGREIDNSEVVYLYNKTFEVRMYHQISDYDRIRYGNKYYRILNIEKDRTRQELIIETEEINE